MTELKPCPFCGVIPHMYTRDEDDIVLIQCQNQKCLKPSVEDEWEKAIEAWNIRYEPTCHIDYSFSNGFDELETVMECGHTIIGYLPDYCPGCGAKVVIE